MYDRGIATLAADSLEKHLVKNKSAGGKSKSEPVSAFARLNMKMGPIEVGELFEDPLNKVLKKKKLGEVTGGGTAMLPSGEIDFVGIDIDLFDAEAGPAAVCEELNRLAAAKGSVLEVTNADGSKKEFPFGIVEGVGAYINGTELPDDVYEDNDINDLIDVLNDATMKPEGGRGVMLGHWEGPEETALYFYGSSGEMIALALKQALKSQPLGQKSRVVPLT